MPLFLSLSLPKHLSFSSIVFPPAVICAAAVTLMSTASVSSCASVYVAVVAYCGCLCMCFAVSLLVHVTPPAWQCSGADECICRQTELNAACDSLQQKNQNSFFFQFLKLCCFLMVGGNGTDFFKRLHGNQSRFGVRVDYRLRGGRQQKSVHTG